MDQKKTEQNSEKIVYPTSAGFSRRRVLLKDSEALDQVAQRRKVVP